MIDKIVPTIAHALDGIKDGASIYVGGFGAVGLPRALLHGLLEQGARNLTIISNNAGSGEVGFSALMGAGRISRLICSFPRRGSPEFENLYRTGKLELELVPQGTLAERIRTAGSGIPAFYTPTGVGTRLAEGKEVREIKGRKYLLEYALPADFALIEAWQADRWGNLTYRKSGRNFNPIMAISSKTTIVQTQHLAELGALDPEAVVTPGIFVSRVVHVPYGNPPVAKNEKEIG
jgi:3-oxoadipate CoA-transferase, alpha subunit